MPKPFEELTRLGQVRRLSRLGREALRRFGLEGAGLRVIDHWENTTFKVAVRDGEPPRHFLLRVHRLGYQSRETIASELLWLEALRDGTDLIVPEPMRTPSGDAVVEVETEDIADARLCSLLRWIPGRILGSRRPRTDDEWTAMGELTGSLQEHGARWTPPPRFHRRKLDWLGLIGEGEELEQSWRQVPAELRVDLRRRSDRLREALAALSPSDAPRSLIHADLHDENCIVHRGRLGAIDFDDCGEGWQLYDFATALRGEHLVPGWPRQRDAMVRGYRSVRELDEGQVAQLPLFLELRELSWLLWAARRSLDHPTFAELLPEWAPRLAERVAACSSA